MTKMTAEPSSPDDQERTVNLRDYALVVSRGWRTIALCAGAAGAIAFLWSLMLTPIYQATATLQIGEARSIPLFAELETLQQRADPLYSEMEILKSRTIAEDVVRAVGLQLRLEDVPEEMDLHVKEVAVPEVARGEYEVRFVDARGSFVVAGPDGVGKEGRVGVPWSEEGLGFTIANADAEEGDAFSFTLVSFQSAVRSLQRSTEVQARRSTNIVQVSIQAMSPTRSADVANALAEAYIASTVKTRAQRAFSTKNFIGTQLATVQRDLRTAETALTDYKREKGIITLGQEANRILEQWTVEETKMAELETELQTARAISVALQTSTDSELPPTISTAGIRNPLLADLATRLTTLALRRAELDDGLAPGNHFMQRLDAQIAKARSRLLEEVKATVVNLEEHERALSAVLTRYEEGVRGLPESELGLVGLLRKSKVNEDLYTLLLQRHEEARIAEASELGSARLVDTALAPGGPLRPNVPRNGLMGLLLGLLTGVGLVFLLEHFDNSVRSVRDLEQNIGLPVFGLVPDITERGRKTRTSDSPKERERRKRADRLVCEMDPGSLAVEAYRSLRTNIQFATPDVKAPCYLITSAGPGEGKSLTSTNLGITLAQMGQRVILVDADMRRPVLHRLFGMERGNGLSDVLAANGTWRDYVRSTKVEGLDMLAAGQLPPNPAELLASDRMRALIEELRENYDLVLVDSPPAVALTDASILGRIVNGSFLVVRSGVASTEAVRRAKMTLENVGSRLLGAIFNGASLQEGLGLPGYYRYYYSHYHADNHGNSGEGRDWRLWIRGLEDWLSARRVGDRDNEAESSVPVKRAAGRRRRDRAEMGRK